MITLIVRDLVFAFMGWMQKPIRTMELLVARGVKGNLSISEKNAMRQLMHQFVEKGLICNVSERPRGFLKFGPTDKARIIAKLAYKRFSRDSLWWSYVLSVNRGKDKGITNIYPPQIIKSCNKGEIHVICDILGIRSHYNELQLTPVREGSFTCKCGNE